MDLYSFRIIRKNEQMYGQILLWLLSFLEFSYKSPSSPLASLLWKIEMNEIKHTLLSLVGKFGVDSVFNVLTSPVTLKIILKYITPQYRHRTPL